MNDNIYATGYIAGMEEKIYELFWKAYLGRRFNHSVWEWQVIRNPCIKACMVNLWKGNELIAHENYNAFHIILNGSRIVAAAAGTMMVDPNYPGLSIMLKAKCKEFYRDKLAFTYGFPNSNSFPVVRALKHNHVGDIPFWVKEPRTEAVIHKCKQIQSFSKTHGQLMSCHIGMHKFMKERNDDYLNWRFIEKPHNNYECYDYTDAGALSGYIVLNTYTNESGEKDAQIIYIIPSDEYVFSDLICFAEAFAIKNDCSRLKLWMTSKDYIKRLIKLGFYEDKQVFHMTSTCSGLALDNMYVTMSDSDVF
jgi:hypothetical protein